VIKIRGRLFGRDTEQQELAYSLPEICPDLLHKRIGCIAPYIVKPRHRFSLAQRFNDKQWLYELVNNRADLASQFAYRLG
jgi:hypothetical protein